MEERHEPGSRNAIDHGVIPIDCAFSRTERLAKSPYKHIFGPPSDITLYSCTLALAWSLATSLHLLH